MRKIIVLILSIVFLLNFGLVKTMAATGTITGSSAYAWGEKMGWVNFLATGGGITITDTAVTGYAWNSNYGWINLSPTTGGVTNTCAGVLGGYAWSGTLGWISFTGATINANGQFVGMIGTSESTAGRINFDCSNCSVATDWRPSCLTSSSSSSTSTTSSTGWAAEACTSTKPGSAPVITSAVSGQNSVTLNWTKAKDPVTTYLIAYGTTAGSITYGNPNVGNVTSYTIRSLSGGQKYYFKVKAINNCMPGDYSNEVSATPGGGFIATSKTLPTGFTAITTETTETAEGGIPSQLFDIALIVDQPKVSKLADLKARVTFINFGSENTPVKINFKIVDSNGEEYYNSDESTVIQTEGVFNKSFKGIDLVDGKYMLILTTLYNTSIEDEFKQEIEISSSTEARASFLSKVKEYRSFILGMSALLIVLGLIIFLLKRR